MNIEKLHNVYFIGIGGIGMSALARFFKSVGCSVYGYDRTATSLTKLLESEGMSVHYSESVDLIPNTFKTGNSEENIVIYTPAIPSDHAEIRFFQSNNITLYKRSQILGLLSESMNCVAIAGTHGKTTVSTMVSHIMNNSNVGCNAFLGGISTNIKSNYLLNKESEYVVVEADEFDRSFLHLYPYIGLITSLDPDHLDIYKTEANLYAAFTQFANQVHKSGYVIINTKVNLNVEHIECKNILTYSLSDNSDYYASNFTVVNGLYNFTLHTPEGEISNLTLGVPGLINVENAIGASASALKAGVTADELREGLKSFAGVKRRFEVHVRNENKIYIDDYAHHPEEIKAFVSSVKSLYPTKTVTGVFQPHLFSRTQDFADEFATSLSLLDKLIILDIYPAREKPIEGVTSDIIYKNVTCKKIMCLKSEAMSHIKNDTSDILLTLGAGSIDTIVNEIREHLNINE